MIFWFIKFFKNLLVKLNCTLMNTVTHNSVGSNKFNLVISKPVYVCMYIKFHPSLIINYIFGPAFCQKAPPVAL